MYVLGIDSATAVASVAVVTEGMVLAEHMLNNKRAHSVYLLPIIKAVIEEAGVAPDLLAGIAVSSGPGSFTGLRIGMSTAKTLAQVWNLPVVGVSTLDALVYPFGGWGSGFLCPLLVSRKGEVYAALYESSGNGVICREGPVACSVDYLLSILKDADEPVTFLGDAVEEYRGKLESSLGKRARFAPAVASHPRGASVAELGLKKIARGQGVSPLLLVPDYVRPPEAEVKWKLRMSGEGKWG